MTGRRAERLELIACDRFPHTLEGGKLYYSEDFRTSVHLCACGCGQRVVLPIKPAGWTMRMEGRGVSLFPSVGNREFECRSHYLIRDGRVDWLISMSDAAAKESRLLDQAHMEGVYKLSAWAFIRGLARRVIALFRRH